MNILAALLRLLSQWMSIIISSCVIFVPVACILLYALRCYVRKYSPRIPCVQWQKDSDRVKVVGFFHPYCNAGGGGERVLWVAIRALQKKYSHLRFVIYTGDEVSREMILAKASERFNITLPHPDRVFMAQLRRRAWVEASRYPMFTLLGQSLGSLVLGMDALMQCRPDVFVDSMGYAFTLPLFRYLGECSHVGCYVHYPTISTDMLERVAARTRTYNNTSLVSRSPVLTQAKLLYYRLFAYMYGVAGRRADIVMVNSSWTREHIERLWQMPDKTFVVYPPCDVTAFLGLPLKRNSGDALKRIVSIAQFRPEKDHPLQISSFARFLKSQQKHRQLYRLVLIGSCRNAADESRVEALRSLALKLDVSDLVEFRLNVTFDELKKSFEQAEIGLHTMWNEHFGIGVVECMAAGTLILAHNSGGPRLDIVVKHDGAATGFLADDEQSYAEAMQEIFSLQENERETIRRNARDSVARFSDESFETNFVDVTRTLLA